MKRIFTLIFTLLISISTYSSTFTNGKHYETLNLPVSVTPTVAVYFSFFCPHCYTFEPIIKSLKQQLAQNVTFQKKHVSFMGGNSGILMSKSYATMLILKVEDQILPIFFQRIHDQNNPPLTEKQVRQIFVDEGIDGAKFDATFNSFTVDSIMRRMDKDFQDSNLISTPAVIVNNKFVVQPQSISSIDEYIELINYLLTLK